MYKLCQRLGTEKNYKETLEDPLLKVIIMLKVDMSGCPWKKQT